MSVCKAECHMDVEMFLDEYTWWEVGDDIAPSSFRGCLYTPPSQGRRREKG